MKSCGFGKLLFKFKTFFISVYIVHKKRTQTFFMKNIFKNFSRNICKQKFSCVQNSLGFVIVVNTSYCGLVYKLGQKIPSQSVKTSLLARSFKIVGVVLFPLIHKHYQVFKRCFKIKKSNPDERFCTIFEYLGQFLISVVYAPSVMLHLARSHGSRWRFAR